jgi:hypothetical protein
MFKRRLIYLVLIAIIALMLVACGGDTASHTKNLLSKSTKTKLKGDFIFYEKNGSTYYTNCDDILETELCYGKAKSIYLDENRKLIIYFDGYKLYVKPIKSESESIMISEINSDFRIIDDKYLLYQSDGLYLYDLDLKNKIRINDDYISSWDINGNLLSFYERTDNGFGEMGKISKFCTYDIKSKKKTITNLVNYDRKSHDKVSNNIGYFCASSDYSNNERKVMLYKVIAGNEPEIIDSVISEIKNINGSNKYMEFEIDLSSWGGQDGNGLYYITLDYPGYNNEKGYFIPNRKIFNYYDGNKTNNLDKSKINIFSEDPRYFGNSLANLEASSGWYIGSDYHEGWRIKSISKDGNLVCYNYKDKSFMLNIKKNITNELSSSIKKVYYLNDNNLLYLAENGDIVLNNEVIDYKGKDIYQFNDDLSVITYETNSGICIYKDKATLTISSEAEKCYLTNSGNAYYSRGKDLYLYKNDEPIQIATDVNYDGAIEYKIIR